MANHHFLSEIFSVSTRTREIKNDPERRAKSVYFGVVSIVYMVLSVALAAGAVFLMALITSGNKDALLLLIFTVAGFAGCVAGALSCFVGALVRVIAQLSINRRAIGWIALVLLVVCVVAVVIIASMFLK